MSRKNTEIFIGDEEQDSLGRALGMLEENITHLAQSCFDDFTHENAEAAADMGCEAVLIRKQLWHCCEWCANLAGKYNYSKRDYPSDVFKRHKLCRCIVTVEWKQGGVQDVWSKKTYKSQEEAEKERRSEIFEEYEESLRKLIRQAKDSGEYFVDLTECYKNRPVYKPGEVTDCPAVFKYNGETYGDKPEHKITFDPDDDERNTARWYAEQFGENVVLMPKIEKPEGVKVPDYIIEGERYDRKGPGKNKKDPNEKESNKTIDNQVKNQRRQAEHFIIDISLLKTPEEELVKQAKAVMRDRQRGWVETIMIVKDKNLIAVLKRV